MHKVGLAGANRRYAEYMHNFLSNANYLIYFISLIILSADANHQGDLQGYLEMIFYGIVFVGGSYTMELMHGVNALRHLDPSYPWDDILFFPSLFYKWGLIEHRTLGAEVIEFENGGSSTNIPDIDFENDPTAEEDEVVNF